MTTPGGEDVIGGAQITVDMDVDPAQRAIQQFTRDAQGQLRDLSGRFAAEGGRITRSLSDATGEGDRFSLSLRGLGDIAGSAGGALGRAGVALGGIGAAAGSALPLLAGVVTAVQNIAPAGAVAATGLLAVKQASAAVKLGMVGVQEAVTAALDPSDPAAFAEALEKLAPEAQEFATTVRDLQPAFASLQQGVQNELFRGFGDTLRSLSASVLPVLQTNLLATAGTLNSMAQGVAEAAGELASDGTLGTAMAGANAGLLNLSQVPAQATTALGQLAAAGSAGFGRLTAAVAGVAETVTGKLDAAFKSGALEDAVNTAIDLLGQLGGVIGNVFGTLQNVLGAAGVAGGGAFQVLTQITQALETATGTQAFQEAIGSLVETMGVLARTAGPLLSAALSAIAPVFTALAGPAQTLIGDLGEALMPVIQALGPVLRVAAAAVGSLVESLSPLLPIVGDLIASLLPPLVPVIAAIGQAFTQLAPLVLQIGQAFTAVLAPVIASLPSVIQPLIGVFQVLVSAILPVLTDLLTQMAPSFVSLGVAVGQLLVAAGPLIEVLGTALTEALAALQPVITPLIGLVAQLATFMADNLASVIINVVVPAVNVIVALLNGDFSGALNAAGALVTGVWNHIKTVISNTASVVGSILRTLAGLFTAQFNAIRGIASTAFNAVRTVISNAMTSAQGRVSSAVNSIRNAFVTAFDRVRSAVSNSVNSVVSVLSGLRSRITGAVSGFGSLLYNAGRNVVQGLVNGMSSLLSSVRNKAAEIASTVQNAVNSVLEISSPSKVMQRIGRFIGDGLIKGLTGSEAKIRSSAKRLAELLRDAVEVKGISRRESSLLRRVASDSKQLSRLADNREKIADRLKNANTKLDAIESKYAQARSAIANQILSAGEIVQQGAKPTTATAILAALDQSVEAAERFRRSLSRLRRRGLRADLLEQIASAGVEGGEATAKALLAATPKQIAALNESQQRLAVAAKGAGTTVADSMYGAGVKAAQGLVDGLESQQKKIQAQMDRIARGMVSAIKKALKIKSPSRAMQQLGLLTGDGLVKGLDDSLGRVSRATTRLGDEVSSMRTPGPVVLSEASRSGVASMVNAGRGGTTGAQVASPNITVMIGNQVVKDYVKAIVDQENAIAARQREQGVRR